MDLLQFMTEENRRLRQRADRAIKKMLVAKAAAAAAKRGEPAPADDSADDLLDSRELDRESLDAHLDSLGIDRDRSMPVGPGYGDRIDPRVRARASARAAAVRAAREAQLAPGAVDGKSAEPAVAAARLRELGIHDPSFFLPPAKAQPTAPADPRAKRQERTEAAKKTLRAKLLDADTTKRPLDTRTLSADEFSLLCEMRGLNTSPAGSAFRATGNGAR